MRNGIKFLLRTVRIIAQRLDLVAGFCPSAMQVATRRFQQNGTTKTDAQYIFMVKLTNAMDAVRQTSFAISRNNSISLLGTHLNHGTQLFGKQSSQSLFVITSDMVKY